MRTFLALLASAPLFLATSAHAETIRVLAPPSDAACHEEVKGKKADKQLGKLTEWLGSDRTRDAWKELRDFGQPGTHTIMVDLVSELVIGRLLKLARVSLDGPSLRCLDVVRAGATPLPLAPGTRNSHSRPRLTR